MIALSNNTQGELFLKQVEKAKSHKYNLFSLLAETLQKEYPNIHPAAVMNQLKNFDALVNYDASLIKFQIQRNAENIKKTLADIKKIKVLGKDNFKYKKIMIKKLNALTGVRPEPKAYADIVAAAFIAQGFGNINSFKCEFTNFVHNLHNVSSSATTEDVCVLQC